MKLKTKSILLITIIQFLVACGPVQKTESTMAFTVSMEQPHAHYFHVTFRCQGLEGKIQDFKLPVWTPGY